MIEQYCIDKENYSYECHVENDISMEILQKAVRWIGYHSLLFWTESASTFFCTRYVTVFLLHPWS